MAEKHFTATAVLISQESPPRVLLVYHNKLESWLPPGGHIEYGENPVAGVIREVKEETGIDISHIVPKVVPIDSEAGSIPLPNYFLEEVIPAFGKKELHYHLDCVYVLKIPYVEPKLSEKEHSRIGWFTKQEVRTLPTKKNVSLIINAELSK